MLGLLALLGQYGRMPCPCSLLGFNLLLLEHQLGVAADHQPPDAKLVQQARKGAEILRQLVADLAVRANDHFTHGEVAFPRPKLLLIVKQRVEAIHHRSIERWHDRGVQEVDNVGNRRAEPFDLRCRKPAQRGQHLVLAVG